MIRLPNRLLPAFAQHHLHECQRQVDQMTSFPQKVARAETSWKTRTNNKAFEEIRSVLAEMCWGIVRCGYCEDSLSYQIEHIKPKSLYPEVAFVWENYLYTCGRCNSVKSDRFPVFPDLSDTIDENRRRAGDSQPPIGGDPVLVDPRRENPQDFMELDLEGTFLFVPCPGLSRRDCLRAERTIEMLHLNDDPLTRARTVAYRNYKNSLEEYIRLRNGHASPEELENLVSLHKNEGHGTVWREMISQRQYYPELEKLFSEAEEALQW